MIEELFREDAYLQTCTAKVTSVTERGGIVLDRTVFYPQAGGQPGDVGKLRLADGRELTIATTVYDTDKITIVHVPAEGQALPAVGGTVEATIDFPRRFKLMRAHTGLHLLCSLVKYPVRAALNPFASSVAYLFPYLVSGSIVVSLVLGLPTVGPLLLQALVAQDMFLAGAIVLLLGVMTVVGTLISDILLMWIDPRIRLEGRS